MKKFNLIFFLYLLIFNLNYAMDFGADGKEIFIERYRDYNPRPCCPYCAYVPKYGYEYEDVILQAHIKNDHYKSKYEFLKALNE